MLERRVYDLGMLYQTGEAYYRAQRIIANLLGQEAAAISADLKQEILGALYHGIDLRRVGEARARGSSTDIERIENAK
jgi:hypothetical protein